MKLLIIRFAGFGDIMFTTPVFRCIKKQIPNVEIHFLTKEQYKDLTVYNPYIDKFYYFNKQQNNFSQLKKELRKEHYDYIIDLHKNLRSYRLQLALRRKTLAYKKLNIERWLLTHLSIDWMPKQHIALRNLDTVKKLGVKDDGEGFNIFFPENDDWFPEIKQAVFQEKFIAFVIGGSWRVKRLTKEQIKILCSLLHYPVILIGGPEEEILGDEIAAEFSAHVHNTCGKYTLFQSAKIIAQAKIVISSDTGLQYIACALQKPVLVYWGGTSPKLGVGAYYGKNNNTFYKDFIVENLKCQPCQSYFHVRNDSCRKKNFACIVKQNLPEITATAHELMEKN